MSEKKIASRIQNKHDTTVNWGRADGFHPLPGEVIVYDDLNNIKIGKKDANGNNKPLSELDFVVNKLVAGSNIDLSQPDKSTGDITISSPALSKGTDTTNTKTLTHGGTFTAITDTNVNGHTITDTTTTYTLPAETALTVDQSTTTVTLAHNSTFTAITGVTKGDSGHNIDVVKTTFTLPGDIDTDKKTSSENTSNKIFLVGATSQSADGQATYSHDTVYVNTDGHLYDTGSKVATEAMVSNLIGCGTADPTSNTTSQFYFKYN